MFHTIFKTTARDGLRFHARSLARTRDPSLPPLSDAISCILGRVRAASRLVHRVPRRPGGSRGRSLSFPTNLLSIDRRCGPQSLLGHPRSGFDRGHTRSLPSCFGCDAASCSGGKLRLSPLLHLGRLHLLPRGHCNGIVYGRCGRQSRRQDRGQGAQAASMTTRDDRRPSPA